MGYYGSGDFYEIKGYVEELLKFLGITGYTITKEDSLATYHPGRCAKVVVGSDEIGIFGQLHPLVSREFGLDDGVYAAEIEVDLLRKHHAKQKQYVPIPVYPAVERDLSLVMEEDIQAGEVISLISAAVGIYLECVNVFDVYRGMWIG